jgi:metal-responsive CopG/Arc/MetJ family transcriptional regulator
MARRKMLKEEKKINLNILINELLINRIDLKLEKSNDKRSRLIERLLIKYVEENKYKLELENKKVQ